MFEQVKAELFFATPVARYLVNDHVALNSDIMTAAAAMRASSDGVNKSNRGGWHSDGNIFAQKAPCFTALRTVALRATTTITQKIGSRLDLATVDVGISGWMNINGRGAFNAPHTHPGNIWSGVYYVSQPHTDDITSGMIEFTDPRSDLPNWRILDADAFRPKHRMRPKAGEILIFPSYLTHWVYPNETDEERVTIAFNVSFKKRTKANV
jgi:uncharacterized protein (TIGR02466 family)